MERAADIKRQAQNFIKQGRWDEAIRAYERLAQASDPDPYLLVMIGDVHIRRGDTASALGSYTQAIEGYRAVGLLKNAVALGKKLLRYNQQKVQVLRLLGDLTAQDGLAGDAAAFYAAAAEEEVSTGHMDAAAEMLRRGVSVSPVHADCSNRLVDLYVSLDRPRDAAGELLRMAAALRMAGREEIVHYLLERARALDPEAELPSLEPVQGGTTDPALGLRDALESSGRPAASPQAPAVPRVAGDRLSDLEGTSRAKESPAAPKEVTPAAKSAAGQAQKEGTPAAKPAAPSAPKTAAAKAKPPEAAAPEAAPAAAEAAFVEPEAPAKRSTSRSVSVRDEAPAAGALIDLSKILDEFKQGLEQQIAPDDAKSHYDMAMAFMEMNLLGDAVAELAAASHDTEMRPRCCELLGQCYLRQGLPADAERILRRGLESPGLAEEALLSLRYHLSLALDELGQGEEAHELMAEVVRTRPDFMDAATHLEAFRLKRAS
ncbi:MAG: tetratricopeptide repeat protein [Candidatus Eisenbacteria bacterium]|nr:tetratricopeptide repeat protein [Candidatus Eisenbacteria bacterium]